MSTQFDELQQQVLALPSKEKAALAHLLIEELDQSIDVDVERAWLTEAQRRYDAYVRGEIEAREGDEVMQRARERLK